MPIRSGMQRPLVCQSLNSGSSGLPRTMSDSLVSSSRLPRSAPWWDGQRYIENSRSFACLWLGGGQALRVLVLPGLDVGEELAVAPSSPLSPAGTLWALGAGEELASAPSSPSPVEKEAEESAVAPDSPILPLVAVAV